MNESCSVLGACCTLFTPRSVAHLELAHLRGRNDQATDRMDEMAVYGFEKRIERSTGDDFVGIHKDEIQCRVKTLWVIKKPSLYLQSSFD